MATIAKYRFNNSANVLPIFSDKNYEYTYTDETNGDLIIRTIEAEEAPTDISFVGAIGLVSVDSIDTTNMTSFSNLFKDCVNLQQVNFNEIDTSNITNMSYMFSGCSGMTTIDLTGFNSANVTDMSNMFKNCTNLYSINAALINVGNVENMNAMFQGCSNFSYVDLRGWNTAKVTNMGWLFDGCSNLITLGIRGVVIPDDAIITNMISGCNLLYHVIMDDCNVNTINKMISLLPQREASDESRIKINLADTSSVNLSTLEAKGWSLTTYEIVMRYKFDKSIYTDLIPTFNSAFTDYVVIDEHVEGNIVTRAIGHENLKPTKAIIGQADEEPQPREKSLLSVEYLDTSNLNDMAVMFARCINLQYIRGIEDWDVSRVTSMSCAFYCCEKLTTLDLSNWDVSNVADMYCMFCDCY